MEQSPCAVSKMSNLLDAHDNADGAALLVWSIEEDSENIGGLESNQDPSGLLAYPPM